MINYKYIIIPLHRAIKNPHGHLQKKEKTHQKRNSDETGMYICTRGFNKNNEISLTFLIPWKVAKWYKMSAYIRYLSDLSLFIFEPWNS